MEAAEPPLSSAEAGVVVDMSPVVLVTDAVAAVVVLEEKDGPATVGRLGAGSLGLESCSSVVAAAAAESQLVAVVPEVVGVVPKVVAAVVGIVVVVLEIEAVVEAETAAAAWALVLAS